jgi:hypothetical protein
MIKRDHDDDNNIKYIHKPIIVKENDPLTLIGNYQHQHQHQYQYHNYHYYTIRICYKSIP